MKSKADLQFLLKASEAEKVIATLKLAKQILNKENIGLKNKLLNIGIIFNGDYTLKELKQKVKAEIERQKGGTA